MTTDTKIGGRSGQFPATRWSAIVAARSKDSKEKSRGLDAITTAYWKPIYKYFRLRWGKSNEDAKDLTQEFFTRVIEKEFLNGFDPAKARLRTFLRVCADRFLANDFKASKRLKRGGSVQHVSLDFGAAEAELGRAKTSFSAAATPQAMDDFLQKEFIRSLFGLAVETLRKFCAANGKQVHFQIFEAYDLADEEGSHPGYAELARKFGIATTDVTNYLAFTRREFRRIALEKLREMTVTDAEFRREARALLGVVPE
jgi:DNA-directed RNA polymerase specialized sigma24 family protein